MSSQCPLCLRGYQQLTQHLRVYHKVVNLTERRLLLSLSSGRVDVRTWPCPIAGCGKGGSRLDRHIKKHTELTKGAWRKVMATAKKQKVLGELAQLRASQPLVPMVSDLDSSAPPPEEELTDVVKKEPMAFVKKETLLVDLQTSEPSVPMDYDLDLQSSADLYTSVSLPEKGDKPCENARCTALQEQVEDLKKKVESLSSTLQQVTKNYHNLQWWMTLSPSAQVTRVNTRLLEALNFFISQRSQSLDHPGPSHPTPTETHT